MYESIDNIELNYPSSILVLGPSQSGKTSFICKCLKNWPTICSSKPNLKKVIIFYDHWQPLFRQLRDEILPSSCEKKFIQDVPTDDNLQLEELEPGQAQVVILDDLQDRLSKKNQMKKLFTVLTHHGNTMVFFSCQDLQDGNDIMRTIRKNAAYIVLMPALYENGNTIDTLERSIFTRHKGFLQSVSEQVFRRRQLPYLMVVNTASRLRSGHHRLQTGIFDEETLYLYNPK